MTYQKLINTQNPGLIIIMLDQSSSMGDSYGESTKAVIAADAVNNLIYEIQEASFSGSKVKPRCAVVVIGYGKDVRPLLYGMIDEVALNYKGTRLLQHRIASEIAEFEVPVWVEPAAENGTPMTEAFNRARQMAEEWVRDHPVSYPPVIINITDGEPNDAATARVAAAGLRAICSEDGEALLFNIHISKYNTNELILPNRIDGLDQFGAFLFDISSLLPDTLITQGRGAGFNPTHGSRGFVYNASPETLIKLLSFGSSALR